VTSTTENCWLRAAQHLVRGSASSGATCVTDDNRRQPRRRHAAAAGQSMLTTSASAPRPSSGSLQVLDRDERLLRRAPRPPSVAPAADGAQAGAARLGGVPPWASNVKLPDGVRARSASAPICTLPDGVRPSRRAYQIGQHRLRRRVLGVGSAGPPCTRDRLQQKAALAYPPRSLQLMHRLAGSGPLRNRLRGRRAGAVGVARLVFRICR